MSLSTCPGLPGSGLAIGTPPTTATSHFFRLRSRAASILRNKLRAHHGGQALDLALWTVWLFAAHSSAQEPTHMPVCGP